MAMLSLRLLPPRQESTFDLFLWREWVHLHSGEQQRDALVWLLVEHLGGELLGERDYLVLRTELARAIERLTPGGLARLAAYQEIAPGFDEWMAGGGG